MNVRPPVSSQRTSTMLFFLSGLSGTISGGRYSIDSTCLPSSRGSKALRRLMTRFLCSPKTFLKVTSALGSRYFAMSNPVPSFMRRAEAAAARTRTTGKHSRKGCGCCLCVVAFDAICHALHRHSPLFSVSGHNTPKKRREKCSIPAPESQWGIGETNERPGF